MYVFPLTKAMRGDTAGGSPSVLALDFNFRFQNDSHTSSSLVLNPGAPQGSVLSPNLFTCWWPRHQWRDYKQNSDSIGGNQQSCRVFHSEQSAAQWQQNRSRFFTLQKRRHAPYINGAEVESVNNLKVPGNQHHKGPVMVITHVPCPLPSNSNAKFPLPST